MAGEGDAEHIDGWQAQPRSSMQRAGRLVVRAGAASAGPYAAGLVVVSLTGSRMVQSRKSAAR